jgi:asparagine synthase (glutamine-hydrolysing)
MCGIAGFFHPDPRPADEWRPLLERMTRTLVHRGPDSEGYYLDAHVGLGHRRLRVIDLVTGDQPIANERRDVWVIANGEIYNHDTLRERLEAAGHRFRSRSDAETIVHAYEQWGPDCIERLRGMFSIAIWDVPRRRLLLARDRIGKKPLYYATGPGGALVFGSELKALLPFPGIDRTVSLEALSDYLSLLYVPREKSIFRAVHKLLPGHLLTASPTGVRVQRYWALRFGEPADDRGAADRLAGLLHEATALRLGADVPCGAFLSGGLDSSAVVGAMARIAPSPVRTAAIGFAEHAFDERGAARAVAAHFGTDHEDALVTPDDCGVLDRIGWHFDEPFGDSSAIPTFHLAALARRRVTVALSGDGGDESFGGYRRYVFDLRENRVRARLPPGWPTALVGALGALYPKADYLPRPLRWRTFLTNVARTPWDAYLHSVSAFDEDEKPRLLAPDVAAALGGYRTADLFHALYAAADGPDPLSRILAIDFQTYLPDDILTKVDRASMAHGLEVRCPLLDHHLVEFAARLPAHHKVAGGRTKIAWREAVRPLVPAAALRRAKMGFTPPLGEWLRGPLRSLIDDLVLDAGAHVGFFRSTRVRELWRQHDSGRRDRTRELWGIAMFNLWYRRFAAGAVP